MIDKKGSGRGSGKGQGSPVLTPTQREVLDMLTREGITPKQIALRRETTPRAVRKIIQKLKQMGAVSTTMMEVPFLDRGPEPRNLLRLHAEHWRIAILWKSEGYNRRWKQGNTIMDMDGNTVKLHRNVIEVYSGQNFYGDDEDHVDSKAMAYWSRLGRRLEHDLKVIIVKPRVNNWSRVRQEYATTDSDLAKEQERIQGRRIKVYTTDDGKLWFTTDQSLTYEHEAHHGLSAKQDSKMVNRVLNEWRDGKAMLPSDLQTMIAATQDQLQEIARAQVNTNTQISTLLGVLGARPEPQGNDKESSRPDYLG